MTTWHNSGKVEILLKKKNSERWNQVGQPLQGHDTWISQDKLPTTIDLNLFPKHRFWRLVSKTSVTHDVNHYIFEPPYPGLYFHVPVGHHVEFLMKIDMELNEQGIMEHEDITRYYTPTFEDLTLKEINDDNR